MINRFLTEHFSRATKVKQICSFLSDNRDSQRTTMFCYPRDRHDYQFQFNHGIAAAKRYNLKLFSVFGQYSSYDKNKIFHSLAYKARFN